VKSAESTFGLVSVFATVFGVSVFAEVSMNGAVEPVRGRVFIGARP
jgi:hypothetical protein